MNKTIKKLFAFFTIALITFNVIFAQNTNSNATGKGKIVIVVLDVSGSIKKQFPDITKIIDRAINKNRLNVGDYFVLIPFGDSALPMYSGQLMREEDKTFIANFYKYGFVGLVLEWIDGGMKEDPKIIIARLNSLIQGSFNHALNNAKVNK